MTERSDGAARDAHPLGRLSELSRRALPASASEAEAREEKERLFTALSRRRALPASRRGLWIAAAAAIAAIAVVFALLRPRPDLAYAVTGSRAEGGYIQAAEKGGATVRFSEGSEIVFDEGSRGRIVEVSPHGARLVVESGVARLRVSHLPKAAWSVEAGPFRIAVLGTVFDVRWSGEVLDVRLHEGAIVVRGPVAAGEISLQAGQRLVARLDGEVRISALSEAVPPTASEAPPPSASPPASAAPAIAPSATAVAPPAPRVPWSQRVTSGDYAGVIEDADSRGVDTVLGSAPLADLVALADAARYQGRTDLARRALLAQRSRFAGSSAATAASFLLGRLSEDSLGQRTAAIAYYDQYLAEAPSGAFAAEALGRKMMAVQKTGGAEAARSIAAEYLGRFPGGAYAARAQEIAGSR